MIPLYQIGDVVRLDTTWENHYAIVLDVSEAGMEMQYPIYYLFIQTEISPIWLSEVSIIGKLK